MSKERNDAVGKREKNRRNSAGSNSNILLRRTDGKIAADIAAAISSVTIILLTTFVCVFGISPSDYPDTDTASVAGEDLFSVSVRCDALGIDDTVMTPMTTVGEFIAQNFPTLDDDDRISHPRTNYINDGLILEADKVEKETVKVYGVIPHPTDVTYSRTVPDGVREVIKEGQDGYGYMTVEKTTVNGVLECEKILFYDAECEPVTECVIEGCGGYVVIDGVSRYYSYYRDVTATAYGGEYFTGRQTKSGKTVKTGMIAVDPDMIPLGSSIYIEGMDGFDSYNGYYSAEDTGANINGDRIDVYTGEDIDVAINFGRRSMRVYVFS